MIYFQINDVDVSEFTHMQVIGLMTSTKELHLVVKSPNTGGSTNSIGSARPLSVQRSLSNKSESGSISSGTSEKSILEDCSKKSSLQSNEGSIRDVQNGGTIRNTQQQTRVLQPRHIGGARFVNGAYQGGTKVISELEPRRSCSQHVPHKLATTLVTI